VYGPIEVREIRQLQAEVQDLQSKLQDVNILRVELGAVHSDVNTLRVELGAVRPDADVVARKVDDLWAELSAVKNQIDQQHNQSVLQAIPHVDDLRAKIDEARSFRCYQCC